MAEAVDELLDVLDFVAPLPGLGLLAGRLGNFINGELWGKPTDLPWGFGVHSYFLLPFDRGGDPQRTRLVVPASRYWVLENGLPTSTLAANLVSAEAYLGAEGLKRLGVRKWHRHVNAVVTLFLAAANADYVVLGGGNARLLDDLPPKARRGSNVLAFRGGYRLWQKRARLV